jgi:hypothetical protein
MAYQDAPRVRPSHSETPLLKPVNREEDDATGINVETRKPIHPSMPHMPPA